MPKRQNCDDGKSDVHKSLHYNQVMCNKKCHYQKLTEKSRLAQCVCKQQEIGYRQRPNNNS